MEERFAGRVEQGDAENDLRKNGERASVAYIMKQKTSVTPTLAQARAVASLAPMLSGRRGRTAANARDPRPSSSRRGERGEEEPTPPRDPQGRGRPPGSRGGTLEA